MLQLSIVIPFLGEVKRLEDTLVSVLENRPADCQIVVVLNRPYDDPYDLQGEVCFVQAVPGSGLWDCIELGILMTRAPIVHVLSCGVEATAGWVDAALPHFSEPEVAAVAPVVIDRFDTRRILSAGLRYTSGGAIRRVGAGQLVEKFTPRDDALHGAGLEAGFYRKSALATVSPWIDRTGDHVTRGDLAMALRHAGFRCVLEPTCLVATNREILTPATAYQEGFLAERLFWRWTPRTGWHRSLAAHGVVLAAECLQSLVRPANVCRLAGRFRAAIGMRWGGDQEPTFPQFPENSVQRINPPHFATSEHRQPLRSRAAG